MCIKVSVIIPVYNSEKFLEKNLMILCEQTLKEIEFVCVNDASTDRSIDVLKAFQIVYPDKFVIIDNKENRGPGGARNIGLKYARGEYIGFMDQDDYVHKDMYESLYNEAKKGDYDIVHCGYYHKGKKMEHAVKDIKGKLDGEDKMMYLNTFFIWDKIFKKSLIDGMSMWFRENVIDDDTDFTVEAVVRAEKLSIVPYIYYYYNFNENSTTYTNKIYLDEFYKLVEDLIYSVDKRLSTIEGKEKDCLCVKFNLYFLRLHELLYMMFSYKEFNFELFKKFDSLARKFLPDYYNIKLTNGDNSNLRNIIYDCLDRNIEKSYDNLIDLKRKIQSGEFDAEMNKKKENDL